MCIIYMYKYHAIELWRHVAERAEFPRNRARGYVATWIVVVGIHRKEVVGRFQTSLQRRTTRTTASL
jgi:hypothetical protein